MGKVLYMTLFFSSLDPTYHEASETSRRALLETKMMKDEVKVLEDDASKALDGLGIEKDDLVYFAYAYPLFAGRVSSKPFKNFKHTTESGITIRPELEYVFMGSGSTAIVFFTKEF